MRENNIPTRAQPHRVRAKEKKEKYIYFEVSFYHCCKSLPSFSRKESENYPQTGVTLLWFNIRLTGYKIIHGDEGRKLDQ